MSWDIIFWAEERAVDYVPSSWANEDRSMYKWPNNTKGIKHLIDKGEDIKNNYMWHRATFKRRLDSLKEAKHYSKLGEMESNIDTDPEKLIQTKKIYQKMQSQKTVSCSSSSEDDTWKRPRIDHGNSSHSSYVEMDCNSKDICSLSRKHIVCYICINIVTFFKNILARTTSRGDGELFYSSTPTVGDSSSSSRDNTLLNTSNLFSVLFLLFKSYYY